MEKHDIDLMDRFSEKEKAVIHFLIQGKSNKQIAFNLGVSTRTIEFHLSNIYAKLGISSRSEAILMITKDHSGSDNKTSIDDLRKSTVVITTTEDHNGENSKSPRRIPVKKKISTITGSVLLLGLFAIYFFFFRDLESNTRIHESIPSVETKPIVSMTSSPTRIPALSSGHENTYSQLVDSNNVDLILDWFYIDSSRLNLEITVCNFPVPVEFKPIYIIDPGKISLFTADGNSVEISQRVNVGGGGGGGDTSQDEETSCHKEVFDYLLKESQDSLTQEDSYILDIPVGGLLTGEDGEMKTISSTIFHLDVKPTYVGNLTFTTQKSAVIENKTVTFKGLEVNPSNAVVIFCVYDPQGEQWLPNVNLIYEGNIIYPSTSGLVDGSNGDTSQEMCYRLNYSYPFHPDLTKDPQEDFSILVAKLTKDQPERLSYQAIAHAQNLLATEGIEFSYVIVNHGSSFVITKKPEGLSEADALRKVQDSLNEDAVSSEVILFDLK